MWCHCYSGIVSCHAFLSFHLSDPRACQQLNADLIALDGEYNRLSDHVAKGERDDHSAESLNRVLLVRFFSKSMCSCSTAGFDSKPKSWHVICLLLQN